jgi:hypothetical protein
MPHPFASRVGGEPFAIFAKCSGSGAALTSFGRPQSYYEPPAPADAPRHAGSYLGHRHMDADSVRHAGAEIQI